MPQDQAELLLWFPRFSAWRKQTATPSLRTRLLVSNCTPFAPRTSQAVGLAQACAPGPAWGVTWSRRERSAPNEDWAAAGAGAQGAGRGRAAPSLQRRPATPQAQKRAGPGRSEPGFLSLERGPDPSAWATLVQTAGPPERLPAAPRLKALSSRGPDWRHAPRAPEGAGERQASPVSRPWGLTLALPDTSETMWGTSPPQGPHFKLFQLLVLTGLFYYCSGESQLTKMVKESALLSCDYSVPPNELTNFRIYWQKNDKVVLTIISGKVLVWPEYENRTIADITNNLSIVILALRLSDKGQYTCVVQKNDQGFFKREHLAVVKLSIIVDFQDPIITDLGNQSTDIKKINCSTSGGFPEPHLSWLDNGEELNVMNPAVTQDPETELYTISSELCFNLTRNHTFICVIKYGDKEVSQNFSWIICK
ncbi:PREDICTED: T-lymphocyte activation antigen CD80 [Chrysochloris asiatica]|uniref:T-lymphocyte activation antigen CD80 n=1 Tax=Chrysochloris asiatica TaxID=185453 RepID=A0A9B0TMP2_CHRAS|nr:PREDICTED: T-lymphocyte activation antigen CD80 [Chrysochloris asiatica]